MSGNTPIYVVFCLDDIHPDENLRWLGGARMEVPGWRHDFRAEVVAGPTVDEAMVDRAAEAFHNMVQLYDAVGFHPCGIANLQGAIKAALEAAWEVPE